MRSARLLAVAVLAVVLALSAAQNAFASVELAYDDGIVAAGFLGNPFVGVRFSLPSAANPARLSYIRFSWSGPGGTLNIHITGPDHTTPLTAAINGVPTAGTGVGCPAGWGFCCGYDVSGLGIVVTGDFYVVFEWFGGNAVRDAANSGRSFDGPNLAGLTIVSPGDWLIRVDVDPISAPMAHGPIGGYMEPVNKLAIVAPYVALFGIIATVAVVVWKRPKD